MRAILLVTASVLALTAGAASALPAMPAPLPPIIKVPHAAKAFHFTPRKGTKVLYDQAYASGFSAYAITSVLLESPAYTIYDSQGADDFVLPKGRHRITAVYAPGVDAFGPGRTARYFNVTFYSQIVQGTAGTVLKSCPSSPAQDMTGQGDVTIDVSACHVTARGGSHDYSVSVQAITPRTHREDYWWYWRAYTKPIRTDGLWYNYGGGFGQCTNGYYSYEKVCFNSSGIGPDFAFAIAGY